MDLAQLATLFVALLILGLLPANAQDHGGSGTQSYSPPVSAAPASPYAGLQMRVLKALSEAQIADLRGGRGMTLALAAELNGYPGPLHVIELADALALTADQRVRMQALYEPMKAEAVALGERLIAQEGELDRQFASRAVTQPILRAATAQIAETQAELRAAHLRYHLLTAEVLTADQMQRYAQLRGYENAAASRQHDSGMHQPPR
jgi:Spy/CpxP family protein refolding chaperone